MDDFVSAVNEHRAKNFMPSDTVCVDESISRWYGQGGSWIEHGLPHYMVIDRKTENGFEIQNSACGRSGVMMHPHVVTTKEHEQSRTISYPVNPLGFTRVREVGRDCRASQRTAPRYQPRPDPGRTDLRVAPRYACSSSGCAAGVPC